MCLCHIHSGSIIFYCLNLSVLKPTVDAEGEASVPCLITSRDLVTLNCICLQRYYEFSSHTREAIATYTFTPRLNKGCNHFANGAREFLSLSCVYGIFCVLIQYI
jgi:hypothetical protein